jgi:hypothetical protein
MQLDLVHQKMDVVYKHIADLKAKQKKAKPPAPMPPAKTEAPAPAVPAPESHEKPHD